MRRPYGRRPARARRVRLGLHCAAALITHGALLAAAALTLSPSAHSVPPNLDQQAFEYWAHHGSSVCADLDRDPTFDGIQTAGLDIVTHGHLSTHQAGQVIGLAVKYTCARHQPLIDRFVASSTHPGRGVTV